MRGGENMVDNDKLNRGEAFFENVCVCIAPFYYVSFVCSPQSVFVYCMLCIFVLFGPCVEVPTPPLHHPEDQEAALNVSRESCLLIQQFHFTVNLTFKDEFHIWETYLLT